VSLLLVLVLMC